MLQFSITARQSAVIGAPRFISLWCAVAPGHFGDDWSFCRTSSTSAFPRMRNTLMLLSSTATPLTAWRPFFIVTNSMESSAMSTFRLSLTE